MGPRSAELGSETFTIPADDLGGLHHFRLITQAPVHSLWRQVVHVTSGEADLYVQFNTPATLNSSAKSETPGSDGLVRQLSSANGGGQTWYLAINAQRGSEWSVFAGDIHLRDLGTLATDDTSGSGPDTMPIEGWRFYTTTIPANARGWRMWLQNGAGDATWAHDFHVRRGAVAHPNTGADRTHNGQALEAPPYIAPDVYFISISGEQGQSFQFDSRQQEITNLTFGANTGPITADGFLFHTYRVEVPPGSIGWEVTSRTLTGDPDLAVRRGNVAVPRDNDAFSEVVGAFDDSIALAQPQLADGEFLITVHSTAPYSYDLHNREPVLTDIPFSGSISNDDPDRAAWRYFRITDINAQLGHLGWVLTLADQIPGTELAIRRNALPGRWQRRSNNIPSSQAVNDQSSITGTLQRPGHQADVWYIGVHRPAAQVGDFTLNTAPILAPTASANGHTATVTDLLGGDWSYHRIDVPETIGGLPVLGWEIQLDSWSGSLPAIAVRRSFLPEAPGYSGFTNLSSFSSHPSRSAVWQSGWQIGKSSGDMTGRNASSDNSQSTESYRYLLPMGLPVEPGTYYIGFRHTSAPPATFTWSSSLIASTGAGADHTLGVLPFGGSVSGALAPRDFKIHTLEVPANTPSQRIRLVVPENHEARLYIRHQQLPNSEGGGSSVHDPTITTTSSSTQTILSKSGGEHFIQLPRNNEDFILPGTYFLTIVAEGQSPPSADRISDAGSHVIEGQNLRPGKPYYIGIRASVDSTFSISSSVSEATVGDLLGYGDIPTISATGGQIDVTIQEGETHAWRVVSPEEATRWRHLSTHTGGVQVYLRENFLPTQTTADLWRSNGGTNTSRTDNFGSNQRPREFYLAVVNTSAQPQTFTSLIDWRQFTVAAAASGPGGVAVSPVKALYEPGESVTLTATPDTGFQFNGWSGTATGTQNPLVITLTNNQSITANFGGTNHELTFLAENGFIVPTPEKATYDTGEIINLTALPNPGREFAGWFGAIGGMTNPRSFTVTGPTNISAWFPIIFDSTQVAPPCLAFERGGDGGRWFLQSEITRPERPYALRGGANIAGSSHWIETTIEGPGTLSYWRHVSSAPGVGEFRVFLDGGAPVTTLSGQHSWQQAHLAIPAGFRTVRWDYTQSTATLGGENAAFLDEITFSPDPINFASWHLLSTLDPAMRGPLDRNGSLDMPNLLYYSMALDPTHATSADLSASNGFNLAGDRVIFRYRQATTNTDTTLTPQISTNLQTWSPAVPLETHIIEQCQRHQIIEIHLASPPQSKLFLRLHAELNN